MSKVGRSQFGLNSCPLTGLRARPTTGDRLQGSVEQSATALVLRLVCPRWVLITYLWSGNPRNATKCHKLPVFLPVRVGKWPSIVNTIVPQKLAERLYLPLELNDKQEVHSITNIYIN